MKDVSLNGFSVYQLHTSKDKIASDRTIAEASLGTATGKTLLRIIMLHWSLHDETTPNPPH